MAPKRLRGPASSGATAARLRALVGQAPSVFFAVDLEGRVVMAEGRLLRVIGGRAMVGVGRTIYELFPTAGWVHDGLRRALAGRTVTARGPLGERFYEARFAPVRAPDGAVTEVVALASDVSDLHEAEERLRRQATRVEALAEASRVFAAGLDYQATLATVARRLSELIGDGVLIRTISDDGAWLVPAAVHHPDPARRALRERILAEAPQRVTEGLTARVLRTGETLRVAELTPEIIHAEMKEAYWPYLERSTSLLIAPLSQRHQVAGHITLTRDEGGPPYTREDETLLQDLAYRAAQAIENARLYGEAQAAVVARDEFLSIASHELRTPLTALKLALENMRRVATPDAVAKLPPEYVERVLGTAERQGHRLENLVSALLDVSRIHMGRLELEFEEVDLGAVVGESVAQVEDEAAQSGSELRVRGEPVRGEWDRLRVGQIVTNLLSNAVKYGAGKPIEVAYGASGDRAFVAVRDQGIGIAPGDQRQIFERFERAVSSRNYGGLGLGLYIVRRIVEAHGGTIRVESSPGEGAAFVVDLPLRSAPPPPEERVAH